jgi:hypothetical protein
MHPCTHAHVHPYTDTYTRYSRGVVPHDMERPILHQCTHALMHSCTHAHVHAPMMHRCMCTRYSRGVVPHDMERPILPLNLSAVVVRPCPRCRPEDDHVLSRRQHRKPTHRLLVVGMRGCVAWHQDGRHRCVHQCVFMLLSVSPKQVNSLLARRRLANHVFIVDAMGETTPRQKKRSSRGDNTWGCTQPHACSGCQWHPPTRLVTA